MIKLTPATLRKRIKLSTCAIVLLASAAYLIHVNTGHSATAHNLSQIPIAEDAFLNYDFTEEDHSRRKVDWAISLLFWNNASVNGVKNALDPIFGWETGGPMHAYVNNGDGWQWDVDSGRKTARCPSFGEAIHYRIYAPPSDAFYNQNWGYYTIASIHIDNNECNVFGTWFGNSEKAEHKLAKAFEIGFGPASVREDALLFRNFQRKEKEGEHHWENDGHATKLRMPAYEGKIIS